MGRIFTWNEVMAGKVPSVDDFSHARDRVLSWGENALADGTIDGLRMIGSSLRIKEATMLESSRYRRSDIDIVLSSSRQDHYTVNRAVKDIEGQVRASNIPLDVICWERDRQSLSHPTIFQTVIAQEPTAGNLIGVDPFHEPFMTNSLPRSELESFITLRSRYMTKTVPHLTEQMQVNILQATLEAVPKLGRMLKVVRGEGVDVTKNLSIAYLRDVLPDDLSQSVRELEEVDHEYDSVLEATLQGQYGHDAYNSFLVDAAKSSRQAAGVLFRSLTDRGTFDRLVDGPGLLVEGGSGLSPMEKR